MASNTHNALSQVAVYLVGAGPGDPGLLTIAAAAALRNADIVVYDYLANVRLLDYCKADAQKIYVGKSAGAHTLTQGQINQLLVDKARELDERHPGQRRSIVRLKGGDPYVFGRGGEEGEFLKAHHISFVTIPGITSGIAAPAYAGIPLTHRDMASTITLVTGHEKSDKPDEGDAPGVNYAALAQLGGTLVFYMGVKSLPLITARLIAGGMEKDTPVAVIRWGTHPHQQTVTGTLATITDVVASAKITAPAITIVGRVVALRDTLDWFEQRPLFGQTVLVTRTRQQASNLSDQLAQLGANILEAPTIELAPPEDWSAIDHALGTLQTYDWVVFTSANGVRAAWERLRLLSLDARAFGGLNVAAIGPTTADALHNIGIMPDLIPEKFVGEELAAALRETLAAGSTHPKPLAGKRFLLLRADIARPVLSQELCEAGGHVDDLPIYRTVRPAALPEEVVAALRAGQIHWITFTSAATAVNLHALLSEELRQAVQSIRKISIGPITTAALQELHWPPTVEAATHDIAGIVHAIQENININK